MAAARIATRTFDDPDQLAATLLTGHGKYNVLGRGAFRAESTTIELGRVTLRSATESLPRVAYHVMPPNKVGVLAWPSGRLPVVQGTQIGSGMLMSLGRDMEAYHRTSAQVDFAGLLIDAKDLERVALELAGRALPIASGRLLQPSRRSIDALLALVADARRIARTSPEILAADEACHALEQSLLRATVACLDDAAPVREPTTHARRAQVMSRFEAIVGESGDLPLHVPELCSRIGVPERTLRKCCQQHLGMSPHRFLLRRRIYLARRALLRGDPRRTTVTGIATRHGFWELGRFSVLYRSMFGEVPSATLRRSA